MIDILSYASMGVTQNSIPFALSGSLSALGAGFNPAVQSVALALYARRGGIETGRLFGAISLIQAMRCGSLCSLRDLYPIRFSV